MRTARSRLGEEDYDGRARKPCPQAPHGCGGSGKVNGHTCPRCNGKATVPEDDTKHDEDTP